MFLVTNFSILSVFFSAALSFSTLWVYSCLLFSYALTCFQYVQSEHVESIVISDNMTYQYGSLLGFAASPHLIYKDNKS